MLMEVLSSKYLYKIQVEVLKIEKEGIYLYKMQVRDDGEKDLATERGP